ncbi:MAG: GNAT family N-acetyltransferase [Anaerolineales bacterium]|nr:GNAT family N-acetyltransferase [Anaerolineales bacterium]
MPLVALSDALPPDVRADLGGWFTPEAPGPLIGPHVLTTGRGRLWVDRWPAPRALLAETTDNFALRGDPAAWEADALAGRLRGFVEAPPAYAPLLRALCPTLVVWPRVVFALTGPLARPKRPARAQVRPLVPADLPAAGALSADVRWEFKTWGGASGALASGLFWGAWLEGRLVSVAGTFFLGAQYEDLGVATEPAYRGLGLNTACAAAACAAVQARGRTPSWNTSTDNAASLRVAEKLGFTRVRDDCLYVLGLEDVP